MNRSLRTVLVALAGGAAAAAGSATPDPIDERASYSYVRTVEGRATLASSVRAPGEEVGRNEPLQRGDEVSVELGARVELVLADRNLVRVAGGSQLRLSRIAFSADGDDRTTLLDLEQGEILLDVTEQALGDELPEVRTPAGTIYVHQPGRYRVLLSATGDLQVTVRDGYAELLTESGSTVIRAGEEAWAATGRWGSVEVTDAGPLSALERWSDALEQRSRRASHRELRVEPYLAYSASSLDDYGSWVYVDASWYWRPRVAVGWRPYWDGRWAWTPSGLTWVSYEPWGWLPYHYGTWRWVPGYGWAWLPGRHYAPAWVYWHIGPTWTGWCPIGYYTHHYRRYWDDGFRFGIYGWSGGHWGFYADWSFLPSRRLFDRHGHTWRRTGTHLGRTERGGVPPGVVTTDTAGVPRERWERPADLMRELERRGGSRGRGLVEVTDFVARRPALAPEVERAVRRGREERPQVLRGSPLDPGAPALERAGRGEVATGWRVRSGGASREDAAAGFRRQAEPGAAGRLGGGFGRPSSQDRDGRSARAPFPDGRSAEVPERSDRSPRAEALGGRRSPGSPPVYAAPEPSDRQGWRRSAPDSHRAPGGNDDRGTGRGSAREVGARGRSWDDAPGNAPSGAPVSRVIGGVRRTQPAPRADDRSSGYGRAPSGSAPRQAVPPAGWRGSPQDVAPRGVAPRAPAPSRSPQATAPQRGRAQAPTASAGGGRPSGGSSVSRGSKPSSGPGGSPPKASSGSRDTRSQSTKSQSSSSPPPRRGKSNRGGG